MKIVKNFPAGPSMGVGGRGVPGLQDGCKGVRKNSIKFKTKVIFFIEEVPTLRRFFTVESFFFSDFKIKSLTIFFPISDSHEELFVLMGP